MGQNPHRDRNSDQCACRNPLIGNQAKSLSASARPFNQFAVRQAPHAPDVRIFSGNGGVFSRMRIAMRASHLRAGFPGWPFCASAKSPLTVATWRGTPSWTFAAHVDDAGNNPPVIGDAQRASDRRKARPDTMCLLCSVGFSCIRRTLTGGSCVLSQRFPDLSPQCSPAA